MFGVRLLLQCDKYLGSVKLTVGKDCPARLNEHLTTLLENMELYCFVLSAQHGKGCANFRIGLYLGVACWENCAVGVKGLVRKSPKEG